MWEGIEGNLKALEKSTALLATKAQQLNAYMPTMMSWIDETFESNSRHSQRMRDSRLPKIHKGTPQGETLAADTLGTLVSVSGPRGGKRYNREQRTAVEPTRLAIVPVLGSSSSSSSSGEPATHHQNPSQQTKESLTRATGNTTHRNEEPKGRSDRFGRSDRGTRVAVSSQSGSIGCNHKFLQGERGQLLDRERPIGRDSNRGTKVPRCDETPSRSPPQVDEDPPPPLEETPRV